MKRQLLLGLMILFMFSCLLATTGIVPREKLGVTIEEAMTIYQSGTTEVDVYDQDMNYLCSASANWQYGDLEIDLDDIGDTVLNGAWDGTSVIIG